MDWMWITMIPGLIAYHLIPFLPVVGDIWVIIGQAIAQDYYSNRYANLATRIDADEQDYLNAKFGMIFAIFDMFLFWFPPTMVFFLKPSWWFLVFSMFRMYKIDFEGIDPVPTYITA